MSNRLLDEVTEHLLGDFEVGDYAVTKRSARTDGSRSAADHLPGLLADREHLLSLFANSDDRWLEEDNAFAANEDDRVGRSKVDGEAAAKTAK